MELALAVLVGAVNLVEAPAPVDTEQAEHRQIDAHTQTRTTLEVERIVFGDIRETVTRLDKSQRPNRGTLLQSNRVAQLHGEFVIHITHVAPRGGIVRRERARRVTTHGYIVGGIARVARHTVTTHVEALEGRLGVFIIVSQVTEFGTRHQHKFRVFGQRGEDLAREFPLMVLNQVVALRCGHLRVVLLAQKRVRRRNLQTQRELRTATGVDRVVDTGTRELQVEREIVARTVGDKQVGPILHHIHLVAQLAVEREIVVRPAETLTISEADTKRAQVLVLVGLRLLQLLVVVGVAVAVVVARIGVVQVLIRLVIAVGVAGLRSKIDAGTQ